MTRKFRHFQLSALLVLIGLMPLFSCTKEKERTVEFESTHTTTNELLAPPPMLKQRITGLGTSTKLHLTKFVAISTMDLTTPPPFKISGTSTTYANDGDVFYTSFSGTATPHEDGTRTVEMTHIITGGTGKFENATGRSHGKTVVDLTKPSAVIHSKGFVTLRK